MLMADVDEGAILPRGRLLRSIKQSSDYKIHSRFYMLIISLIKTALVYLQEQILRIILSNYHFMQDCKLLSQGDWHFQHREQPSLLTQTSFLTLNSDFKFMLIATINKLIKLLTIEGRLVFNNGSTVYINIGHQSFIHRFLNEKFDPITKKVIFSIDQASETLTFSGKISNINDLESANRFIKMCQEEIHRRKKSILCVLAIIGVPLDYENALMRKILIEKKKLKNKLEEILKKSNEKEGQQSEEMLVQDEKSNDEGGVILFGEETEFELKQLMQEQNQKSKIVEGGYFTIKPVPYVVRNKTTQETISKRLVVKTLKQQRKKQDSSSSSNRLKMRKQMEIINSIRNKKYLIRYYCDSSSIENMNEVYMDQYEHSLQEYVHYLGDSLEFLQKINISKQVVEAILTLHQSGVIHRDIKPANFLIDDSSSNTNEYKVKIIDFAESYSPEAKNQLYASIDYACSHPYSPLECIDRKGFTENGPMEGIGKKEIDYWSVGITIYEIFFRKLPVSFSRAFLADITSTWKSELLVAVNQREKIGFNLVQDIINIICVKMMKFSQDQRMKLTTTKRILGALESYIKNLLQIVEESA